MDFVFILALVITIITTDGNNTDKRYDNTAADGQPGQITALMAIVEKYI